MWDRREPAAARVGYFVFLDRGIHRERGYDILLDSWSLLFSLYLSFVY